MRFSDKTVIVTGASRGIGRATAVEFGKEGARVVVVYKEQKEKANEVEKIIGKERCLVIQADITHEEDVRQVVAETVIRYGKIDILVNNAGAILRPGDWKSDVESWHKTIDVNLTSAWLMIREIAPIMLKQKSGSIVNVASVYGLTGAAPVLAYTSAKGGLITLTRSFAKELAPNIRVNTISPSNVSTDMAVSAGPALMEQFRQETPLKRIADPIELARAILFLASDDASYITGEMLVVDGGYSLR